MRRAISGRSYLLLSACAACFLGCDGGEVGIYERIDARVVVAEADAAAELAPLADAGTPIPDPPSEPAPLVIDQTGPDNSAGLSAAEVADLTAGGRAMAWSGSTPTTARCFRAACSRRS